MREKLLDLMKNEGLKSSQLAEMLGINPAGISHILAGRNKPGFDLLQKILRRFPRISPDWLLLDQGPMYRNEAMHSAITASALSNEGLFRQDAFQATNASEKTDASTNSMDNADQGPNKSQPADARIGMSCMTGKADVERIIILYTDHTCETFTPSK